ncbi:hypothetical protein [Roseateles sp. L2-2]|uniref:hypothetical protein n=1 Tax=Roseateles TaxID=93681 RepID=UPI003D35BED5
MQKMTGTLRQLHDPDWSAQERKQLVATGLAPLLASAVLAGAALPLVGGDALTLFALLVPVSYAMLVFCLLPAIWLLRRLKLQSTWSVATACGLAILLPGVALYGCFPAEEGKYAGATGYMLLLLALPAAIAAVAGAMIHRIKPGQSSSSV